MIRRILLVGTLILSTVLTLPAFNPVKEFTLDKALSTAFENSHDLTKVKLDKLKSGYQVTEAWGSAIFPKISGQVNYSRAIEKTVFVIETPFFSGQFPAGTDNTITSSFNLSQPLFSGSAFIAVRIANNFAELNSLAVKDFKSKLIFNVKRAFYAVLISEEFYQLTVLNRKRAVDNHRDTKVMFEQGLVSDYDVIRAKVQLDNLEPALIQAENSVKMAKNNLKLLMGLDYSQEISVKGELKTLEVEISNEEELINNVLEVNPFIKQLELQSLLQKDNVSLNFAQHLPSLNAFANFQSQAQENDGRGLKNFRFKNSLSVGFTLKLPIFEGFQISSRVEQAEVDYLKSMENLSQYRQILQNNADQALLKLREATRRILSQSSTVKQAERGVEIAKERYKSGLGTQLELLDSEIALDQAKLNKLSAIYDQIIAKAELDQLLASDINKFEHK